MNLTQHRNYKTRELLPQKNRRFGVERNTNKPSFLCRNLCKREKFPQMSKRFKEVLKLTFEYRYLKKKFPLISSFLNLQLPTAEDGVLVYGMFMERFRWDEKEMVVRDYIKGIMNSPICMFNMEPKVDFVPDKADYVAPLYKTSARAGVLSTTGE